MTALERETEAWAWPWVVRTVTDHFLESGEPLNRRLLLEMAPLGARRAAVVALTRPGLSIEGLSRSANGDFCPSPAYLRVMLLAFLRPEAAPHLVPNPAHRSTLCELVARTN